MATELNLNLTGNLTSFNQAGLIGSKIQPHEMTGYLSRCRVDQTNNIRLSQDPPELCWSVRVLSPQIYNSPVSSASANTELCPLKSHTVVSHFQSDHMRS